MMDPIVLLTPILILAVTALVRFLGCYSLPDDVHPNATTAVPGDQKATILWQDTGFPDYNVKRGTAANGPFAKVATVPKGTSSYVDMGLTNGTTYFWALSADTDSGETVNSNVVSATPEADVTVTFDAPTPTPAPGAFSGAYKNLSFPAGQWIWVDTFTGGGPANAATFPAANSPGGDVMFVNGPRYLESIRVFPKRAASVTITDNSMQNPPVTVTFQAADANAVHFISAGWTQPSPSFNIATDIGFDLLIDTFVYTGPA